MIAASVTVSFLIITLALRVREYLAARVQPTTKEQARDRARLLVQEAKAQGHKVTIKGVVEELERQQALSRARHDARAIPQAIPARERVKAFLVRLALQAIRDRSLDTPTGWEEEEEGVEVLDRDVQQRTWLIGNSYSYHYSNRFGDRNISGAFLCGREHGQIWAVRVPGTLSTVPDALAWLEPATVTKAKEKGRIVLRQGDFYFVEMPRYREDNMDALQWTDHEYAAQGRLVAHPQHGHVIFPQDRHFKAVPQSQMGHGGSRVSAD